MGRNMRNKKDNQSSGSFIDGLKDKYGTNSRFNSGPRELHKAKCSECNADCDVPFKPTEGKPVYCRECYKKRKTW